MTIGSSQFDLALTALLSLIGNTLNVNDKKAPYHNLGLGKLVKYLQCIDGDIEFILSEIDYKIQNETIPEGISTRNVLLYREYHDQGVGRYTHFMISDAGNGVELRCRGVERPLSGNELRPFVVEDMGLTKVMAMICSLSKAQVVVGEVVYKFIENTFGCFFDNGHLYDMYHTTRNIKINEIIGDVLEGLAL